MRTRPCVSVTGLCIVVLLSDLHSVARQETPSPASATPNARTGVQAPAVTGAAILSPGPSAARRPATSEEFDAYFNEVSNWGRWGAADELGAANLITEAKRRQAASLVRIGRAVGLAHSPLTAKDVDNASPFEHTMNKGFSTDTYRVSYHGYAHSHLDALCHILYKD